MSRLSFLMLLTVGCGAPETDQAVRESPTWFPLGGEVYHVRDVAEEQKNVLAIEPWSRWFLGYSRRVDRAEYDAHRKARQESGIVDSLASLAEETDSFLIATAPAYPKHLEDLPLEDQGASLSLEAGPTDDPSVIRLVLRLEAADRPVWREVEHRWTNTLPFLFGFYADGEPVRVEPTGMGKFGGSNRFVAVAEKDKPGTWSVRMNLASLDPLLGGKRPQKLEIVAVFSERQHIGWLGDDAVLPLSDDTRATHRPQIVVRSPVARLR